MYDMGGPNTQDPEVGFYEYPGNMTEEAEWLWGYPDEVMVALAGTGTEGDPGSETTLNHVLTSIGLIDDVVVGDVMDTKEDYLCYEYEQLTDQNEHGEAPPIEDDWRRRRRRDAVKAFRRSADSRRRRQILDEMARRKS
jgi:hypothetical protein